MWNLFFIIQRFHQLSFKYPHLFFYLSYVLLRKILLEYWLDIWYLVLLFFWSDLRTTFIIDEFLLVLLSNKSTLIPKSCISYLFAAIIVDIFFSNSLFIFISIDLSLSIHFPLSFSIANRIIFGIIRYNTWLIFSLFFLVLDHWIFTLLLLLVINYCMLIKLNLLILTQLFFVTT